MSFVLRKINEKREYENNFIVNQAIYASDLIRAYETAKIFSKVLNLDINTDKGLREIHAGEWEGKNMKTFPRFIPMTMEPYGYGI